jgi:hypothetical protein
MIPHMAGLSRDPLYLVSLSATEMIVFKNFEKSRGMSVAFFFNLNEVKLLKGGQKIRRKAIQNQNLARNTLGCSFTCSWVQNI